jgi:hypothetical protein
MGEQEIFDCHDYFLVFIETVVKTGKKVEK